MALKDLQDRTTSGFDLSIGTGMALQAIFNTTREVYDPEFMPDPIDIKSYDVFVVNWYTIIRNIISAVGKDTKKKILSGSYKNDLVAIANMELETIKTLCEGEGVEFIVLAPDYKKLKSFIFTDKLTQSTDIFHIGLTTIGRIDMDYEDNHNPILGKVLMLTHIPFDLLINKSKVDVLQSHTATILPKHEYNKKYRKTSIDTSFLPFNSILLYLLADSTGLLKLLNRQARQDAIETLREKKVNQKTTRDRVMHLLYRSKYASDFVKGFKDPY